MATKVEFVFSPFDFITVKQADKLDGLTSSQKAEIVDKVRDFLLEAIPSDMASQTSSVTGSKFEPLSKEYAKAKKAAGKGTKANLIFEGDLIDSIRVRKGSDYRLKLTVLDSQMGKADGHNNHSGDSPLPRRAFIPNADDDETFRPAIRKEIKSIVQSALEEFSED